MSGRNGLPARKRAHALESELSPLLSELALRADRRGERPIVFTAPARGAGTTMVCATVAAALADDLEVGVTLIEANLDEPRLAERFGLDSAPGLAEVLDGTCELAEALRAVPRAPDFWVLPAGRPREPRPGELGKRRMREVLSELGAEGRLLLIDAPPFDSVALTAGLLQLAVDVVLVLDARRTRRQAAVAAARACVDRGSKLLGTVLNRA